MLCEGNAVYRATCDYDTEMTENMLKHWDSLPVKDSVLRLCGELKEVDLTEIQAGRWKMVKHGQGNLDFTFASQSAAAKMTRYVQKTTTHIF